MPWSSLTLAQLQLRSLLGIVETMRAEARARRLPDPWLTIPAQITSELRGSIAFSGRYRLETDPATLPDSLLLIACKAVVREMKTSLGVALSDDERADATLYEARLKALHQGAWPVDAPATPLPTDPVQTSTAAAELASSTRRQATTTTLGGIL